VTTDEAVDPGQHRVRPVAQHRDQGHRQEDREQCDEQQHQAGHHLLVQIDRRMGDLVEGGQVQDQRGEVHQHGEGPEAPEGGRRCIEHPGRLVVVVLGRRGMPAQCPDRQQGQEEGCTEVDRGIGRRVAPVVHDMLEHRQAEHRVENQHDGRTTRHGPAATDGMTTAGQHENLEREQGGADRRAQRQRQDRGQERSHLASLRSGQQRPGDAGGSILRPPAGVHPRPIT